MPFREIVGHRRLIALLQRSILQGALPPSLIFAGPDGVGKRHAALATAQSLNCPNRTDSPEGSDACGICPACVRIGRGVHPDVLLVAPGESGSIKIEQVRAIVEQVNYRPFEGRRRVVIVDDADALVLPAQNALLKTLEEPPSSANIILVTSRPDTLLPTVLSRCPRLRFRALDTDEVVKALVQLGRSQTDARLLAATSEGSIGRALQLSAGDLVDARETAVEVLVAAAGTDDPRRRIDTAKDLAAKSGSASGGDRDQLAMHLRAMASILRDVELAGTGAASRLLANPDVEPELGRLERFRGDRGLRAFVAIDRALEALDRNAGVKIVADWLVLQL